MRVSPQAIDIFLQPGEVYFGDRSERIRTLLGSCVAITLWHPRLKLGGMCHYMLGTQKSLPPRGALSDCPGAVLDGRYADQALALLLRAILASGTDAREYVVKLFGGGNMFVGTPFIGAALTGNFLASTPLANSPLAAAHKSTADAATLQVQARTLDPSLVASAPLRKRGSINVADDNVRVGRELLAKHGLVIAAEHLGGSGHRQIIFEIESGDVWVRKYRLREHSAVVEVP